MNIKELIRSTNKVPGRDKSSAFRKKFGSIFVYNKTMNVFGGGGTVVVNMMIGGATEMIRKGGKKTPVAYHKVSLALNIGKENVLDLTEDELITRIRLDHEKYKDKDEWTPDKILKIVLDNPSNFFKDATIFRAANNKNNYVVIPNYIPEDSEIQVWCSCSDYYWTFQYYNIQTRNKDNRGTVNLYGDKDYPKVYNYKSEAGKKAKAPLRNPGRHPGMCKHLMLLLAMLMKENVIKDTKSGFMKAYRANYNTFIKPNRVKERISASQFDTMIKKYQREHRQVTETRRIAHYISESNISKKNFNPSKGTFKWEKRNK